MSKKVKDFRPASRNANKHTARGMGALQKSIQSDGWIGAMTTAADGEMIAGSARIETVAQVFGTDAEPIIVESDGTRPVLVVRTDIPNADDKRAQRLALADNRVHEIDLTWDAEVLAGLDADVLEGLWTPAELSDLGQQWANEQERVEVLGAGDQVDKEDRAGSSPWDRVVATDKVRCLIGDLEFGVKKEFVVEWLANLRSQDVPLREAAEQWLEQALQ